MCYWSVREIAAAPLDDILTRYETLDQSKFHHKLVKRSADSISPDVKHVQFDSHGRHFHLLLELQQNLWSPDFRVISVDKNNKERDIRLDMVKFYQGVLSDEPTTSEVHAFWEEDGTMTATIKTHADVYYVEPSWRHLPKSSNYSMITYKGSDMKNADNLGDNHSANASYCGFVRINNNDTATAVPAEPTDRESRREKRSSKYPAKNTCPLLLVADYHFFRNMGQGSVSKTAIYLIGLIERVDAIYRNTNFGPGYEQQMGFEIKEMRIHEAPSVVVGGQPHYNMERETWDTKDLLEAFSYGDYLSNFCLAHLFTALVDTNNILGLSYIASPQRINPGGICSQGDNHTLSALFVYRCLTFCSQH
ncbi:ADAM 17-like protease [Lamellibrachia satsuma]|nr:ADAM 17-like protease [Lamellibrachia satsuma]